MTAPSIRQIDGQKSSSASQRFAGRRYKNEDDNYYQGRVAHAEGLKANGMSHNQAWFKAFQAYPRVYLDDVDPALVSSFDDTAASQTF